MHITGTNSLLRNCFGEDADFDDCCAPIIVAYEEASRKAAIMARYAISGGGDEGIKRAQWYEAVAQSFERALAVFAVHHGEYGRETSIEIPQEPDFS